VKKHLRNDRSRFGDVKLKIMIPLNMARAQRKPFSIVPPGGAIYVTFQITWTISNGKKK